MHHILAYSASLGAAASEADTAAATDPSFSIRNNHYIFSEPYELIAAMGGGANLTDARLSSPGIDAIAPARIFPSAVGITPPAVTTLMDLRNYPMALPQNEEIKALLSNSAGVAEQDSLYLLIAPPSWNMNLPRGIRRQLIKVTASITLTLGSWSADAALAFADASPRGGWYTVVGCWGFGTNLAAYRINFVRQPIVQGRKLFPGGFALSGFSGFQAQYLSDNLGPWGQFHTFEPPLVAGFGMVAGAQTCTFLLDVIYTGDTPGNVLGV